MKGFTEADWAEYKTKFQQEFTACPEWAEAESIFVMNPFMGGESERLLHLPPNKRRDIKIFLHYRRIDKFFN